ncbi:Inner membrane protein YihY, formerly thought to be RNase BN [hydrothermal vent metagenome]|uniref:Inner membrane protein YihY, formerly thought to be RNase BN n=1 Tax=hydrothermal vent metagenome TaxID=652676 RepID=A0A1W1EHF6_9ZZZZ
MYQNSIRSLFIIYYIFIRDFLDALLDKKLGYFAASLSFYTILSAIPIMIVIFYIFTLLPIFDDVYLYLRDMMINDFLPIGASKDMLLKLDKFLLNSNNNIGILGIIYVFLSSTIFFKNYDSIVNEIFRTKKRTLVKDIKVYWILIISVSLVVPLSCYLSMMIDGLIIDNMATTGVRLFYFLPYIMMWTLFFIAYKVSINKKVSTNSAFISSFISSGIWYIGKFIFVFVILHNEAYKNIYGSLSIILFFMFWIYISWAIFLRGLKLCYVLDRDKVINNIIE